MKIEFDSDDLAIIGAAVVCALLIFGLVSCEKLINDRVEIRLKEERSK